MCEHIKELYPFPNHDQYNTIHNLSYGDTLCHIIVSFAFHGWQISKVRAVFAINLNDAKIDRPGLAICITTIYS